MRSAVDIASRVRSGEYDPVDVVEESIARLDEREPVLHAFVAAERERARRAAEGISLRLQRGDDPGPLAGVPIALKDNIAVAGSGLTAGSRMLEGYRAPQHAHVVQRLLDAGAVLLGRANLDEFAMGSSTEHSSAGPTRNPWDPERVPGGSSGGSAAAVAAGIVPVALGSETGGSIRVPAALCGVTGFKPTYGAVSRRGLVAFSSSLDVVGPLAAFAEDAALIFDVIAGHDPGDATTLPGPAAASLALRADLEGLRIGLPGEFLEAGVDRSVLRVLEQALATLEDAGAITQVIPPGRLACVEHAVEAYQVLACAEAASNLGRYDGAHFGPRADSGDDQPTADQTRGERFGEEVRRRLAFGTWVLSAGRADGWLARAEEVRRRACLEHAALFRDVDLIAGPTSPVAAFRFGERLADPSALARGDVLTAPACLAGLPSVSVPCGLVARGGDSGLPVGLCLTGPAGEDGRVLAAARAFEAARGAPERSPLAEGAA